MPRCFPGRRLALGVFAALAGGIAAAQDSNETAARDYSGLTGDASRGFYVARMAGCITCHRAVGEGESLFSGGLPIESRAGTFIVPNITPHPEDGIGNWTFEDFARSLTEGLDPEGRHYYPVYPYPFYTHLTSQDIVDLWEAVKSVPPVAGRAPRHRLRLFYRMRGALGSFKSRALKPGELTPDDGRSEQWNRGRYLAEGPAHCGVCHTPRVGTMGLRDLSRRYQGGVEKIGSNGPDITTATLEANGWTEGDLAWSLRSGIMPSGDAYGSSMAEVVHHGTRYLSNADLAAIANYFFNQPPATE